MRRVWAKAGQRPLARSTHKYRWLYLYGFVRPSSGDVEWWLASRVNIELWQAVLDAFAAALGAGRDKTVILVLDNAGWHTSPRIKVPAGIRLCFLPSYSPELQPAERLWPLTNETVANRAFANLDDLAQALDRRCAALSDAPEKIAAHTKFHWWPDE